MDRRNALKYFLLFSSASFFYSGNQILAKTKNSARLSVREMPFNQIAVSGLVLTKC